MQSRRHFPKPLSYFFSFWISIGCALSVFGAIRVSAQVSAQTSLTLPSGISGELPRVVLKTIDEKGRVKRLNWPVKTQYATKPKPFIRVWIQLPLEESESLLLSETQTSLKGGEIRLEANSTIFNDPELKVLSFDLGKELTTFTLVTQSKKRIETTGMILQLIYPGHFFDLDPACEKSEIRFFLGTRKAQPLLIRAECKSDPVEPRKIKIRFQATDDTVIGLETPLEASAGSTEHDQTFEVTRPVVDGLRPELHFGRLEYARTGLPGKSQVDLYWQAVSQYEFPEETRLAELRSRFQLFAGANFASSAYTEASRGIAVNQVGLTGRLLMNYAWIPQEWDLQVRTGLTLLSAATTRTPSTLSGSQYYHLAANAVRLFQKPVLGLALKFHLGLVFLGRAGSDALYAYDTAFGPQFQLTATRAYENRKSLSGFIRYAILGESLIPNSFSNGELCLGALFEFPIGEKQWGIIADWSTLTLASTKISSTVGITHLNLGLQIKL